MQKIEGDGDPHAACRNAIAGVLELNKVCPCGDIFRLARARGIEADEFVAQVKSSAAGAVAAAESGECDRVPYFDAALRAALAGGEYDTSEFYNYVAAKLGYL